MEGLLFLRIWSARNVCKRDWDRKGGLEGGRGRKRKEKDLLSSFPLLLFLPLLPPLSVASLSLSLPSSNRSRKMDKSLLAGKRKKIESRIWRRRGHLQRDEERDRACEEGGGEGPTDAPGKDTQARGGISFRL